MIYVALYRGISIPSRLIQFWTRSGYSHACYWFFGSSNELRMAGIPTQGCIISADAEGVVEKPVPDEALQNLTSGKLAVDLFEWKRGLSLKQQVAIWKASQSYVGWKYDYKGAFLGFPLFKRKAFKKRKKSGMCSGILLQGSEDANRYWYAGVEPILVRYKPWREPPESINTSPTLEFVKTVFLK